MRVASIKTHKIHPGESICDIIIQYISTVSEGSVIVITSKILSICQNRLIKKESVPDKFQLIQQEADLYLEGEYSRKYGVCLTIKNGILIPTAGIDESNGNDYYILYPVKIQAEAVSLWNQLRNHYGCQQLGILITDSHTTPLRRGVTGIALGWCGFQPLYNYIGKPDLYGNPLRVTQVNILDSLAASAVYKMGEGDEQTPLAIITENDKITFQNIPSTEAEVQSISISLEEDLYAPILQSVAWKTQKDGGAFLNLRSTASY